MKVVLIQNGCLVEMMRLVDWKKFSQTKWAKNYPVIGIVEKRNLDPQLKKQLYKISERIQNDGGVKFDFVKHNWCARETRKPSQKELQKLDAYVKELKRLGYLPNAGKVIISRYASKF